jgi:chitinase
MAVRLAGALLAVCVSLAGCGSDDKPSPVAAVDSTTDTLVAEAAVDPDTGVDTTVADTSSPDTAADDTSVVADTAVEETVAEDTAIDTAFDGPFPTIAASDVTVAEGNSGTKSITFSLTLSAPAPVPVSVNWATADGTALAGSDYVAATGKVVFGAGTISVPVDVVVNGDTSVESDETFFLDLSMPVNGTLGKARGTATIDDDDIDGPTISISDVTVSEGNSGSVEAKFAVTLSAAATKTVTVSWATLDGTARAAGTLAGENDYFPGSGTFSFAPGETTKNVTVNVRGDAFDEADEAFSVELSSSINATIAKTRGAATITDDDATPSLSIADVRDTEGAFGATKTFTFNVTLSAPSGQTVTVNYATENDTATAPGDFIAVSGTLTFAPGETTKPVRISVVGNNTVEPDETFKVKLLTPTNATVADGEAIGTIQNDD